MKIVILTFTIFYFSFVSSHQDKPILNANFFPSQCWDPSAKKSSESSADHGARSRRSSDYQPNRILQIKPTRPELKFIDLSSFSEDPEKRNFHENQFDVWVPPPDPPNITEIIANNDIRAYYYYLSDPNLSIEIKLECAATEQDEMGFINRHKYVFVDSNGNEIEVVTEDKVGWFQPKAASAAANKRKVAKDLLLSLVGGGKSKFQLRKKQK